MNPTIFWSQNGQLVRLRIPQPNPFRPPIVTFDDKYLKLIPEAFNIEENNTLYKLQFFDLVVPDRSYFRIGINEISYDILKSTNKLWPRLLNTTDYCPFLQEEFIDHSLSNENDSHDQNSQKNMQNSFRELRSNKNFGRRRKQNLTPEEVRRIYLFLYNLFQLVGFIYILIVLSVRYAKEGADSTPGSYKALGCVIKLLFLIQIQEVFFSAIDKSRKEPRIQTQHIVFHLLLIYTFMELSKYPYYLLRSFHVDISFFLTWIRCTFCLFLYPIAFLFEGVVMFKNLSYFEETERYSLYLPNQLNFSFHLPSFIKCYLLLGLFPFLYLTIARHYYYRLNLLSRKRSPIHTFKID